RHIVESAPPGKDMTKVLTLAAEGDHAAMGELLAVPEKDRGAADWLALAKGHAALGQTRAALTTFRRAVQLDKELAKDDGMLKVVRRAVDGDETQRLALDFAAERLGEPGADILYEVSTTKPTPKNDAPQMARSLLDKEEVRSHASKALAVALELKHATRCEEAKRLVERAIESADERSVRSLTALSSRRGCGFLGLSDCFSCLRKGDDLANALSGAQSRKAPKY
ncbi:MAG TPA: hypothetical protein VHU80_01690, partial [Polyangiaceae bacterium]|nr:hypothetical protein [Polyangiaceae bacterium]